MNDEYEDEYEDEILPYGLKFSLDELKLIIGWYEQIKTIRHNEPEDDVLARELKEIINEA